MDQLECNPWLDALARLSGPSTDQLPGAQPQVFRNQEPEADHIATDLVGQELSHPAFKACGVARFRFQTLFGSLSVNGRFRLWTIAVQFFLKAKVFDDPIDAANADCEAGLRQFLRDDVGGSVGVEEPMPNHLTHSLSGTAVVALRASFPAGERRSPLEAIDLKKLIVTLLGEAELFCGLFWSKQAALPLNEHKKLLRDFVEHRKRASRANDRLCLSIVGKHSEAPNIWRTEEKRPRRPRESIAEGRSK